MASQRIYFRAVDASGRGVLTVSDGTAAGTRPVAVANVAPGGLSPTGIAALSNGVVFEGVDSAGASALYVLDGETGVVTPLVVRNSFVGPKGLDPSNLHAMDGKVFFQGRDAQGTYSLFVTNGSVLGTYVIPYRFDSSTGLHPTHMTEFADKLYFAGQTSVYSQTGQTDRPLPGLLVYDPKGAGISEIPVFGASAGGLDISSMAVAGGRLVFEGLNVFGKSALWVSDGTGAGTIQLVVPGLNPGGSSGGRPTGLTSFGSRAAFVAADSSGRSSIWVTDGTANGTVKLAGVSGSPGGVSMTALPGDRLAFIASDPQGRAGVYVTDGKSATLVQPAGILPGSLQPNAVMTMGGQLLFDGLVGGTRSLFTSDGTGAGTKVLAPGTSLGAAAASADSVTLGTAAPPGYLGVVNGTTGTASVLQMSPADLGGPNYLDYQYIYSGPHDMAMSTQAPNVFIHSGSGTDALQVSSGRNVLDGGTGSNFMTGGTGTDTFFTDARSPGVVWNTIRNFHAGDAMTLWGFNPGVSSYRWEPGLAGARGSEGATLRANIVGGAGRTGDGIDASVTFAGLSVAQAQNLQIVTGTVSAGPYLYVYNPGV